MRLAKSAFEYGKVHTFEGIIVARPYPTLLVPRPGEIGAEDKYSRYLLVAPGKHGADGLVGGFDGKAVRLRGQLVYRENGTMIEIEAGSITSLDTPTARQGPTLDLGSVTVTGEIVDSKCYLGVMNPGNGKVHRDCAVRCIGDGAPPAFVARDASGETQVLLLVGSDGRALNREVLSFVAEPLEIAGELVRSGSNLILKAEPSKFRRECGIKSPAWCIR